MYHIPYRYCIRFLLLGNFLKIHYRGSYTAAQKAFEKVLQLSSDSVYAKLMIAGIRHRVGRWREAVQDYTQILGG